MRHTFKVRDVRRKNGQSAAQIEFGCDLYENDDLLGKQVRPCVFEPSEALKEQLNERLGEEDAEFEITNLSERRVGLKDRLVGYAGKITWTSTDYYEYVC